LKFELKSKLRLMCEGGFFHLVFITDNSLLDYITSKIIVSLCANSAFWDRKKGKKNV